MPTPKERIRRLNNHPVQETGTYVLYWMQANRRLSSNHSLDYALQLAKSQKKELVVYEGLRKDYPWNSYRIHKFILEGMIENREEAKRLGINYWCFVESETQPSKGILRKIAKNATTIVTDDFPCFIIPEQSKKLSANVECALLAVDGNSIIPFSLFERFASAARILRLWIHKKFPEYFSKFAKVNYTKRDFVGMHQGSKAPFENFNLELSELDDFLRKFKFEHDVQPYAQAKGGRKEALKLLGEFLQNKMNFYIEERSKPNDFEHSAVSGLSPYLHFGFISAEEIVQKVLDHTSWNPESLSHKKPGDRENFYTDSPAANHFLDELITWRDMGYLYFFKSPGFNINLDALPDWVKKNLENHRLDKRDYVYTLEQWEEAKTHDELWNAAQNELKITGRMHNYMRMLWGKKVIEWSASYEDAFNTLEHLNNKYAYDGRNPNSYTGILWCFGLFDRPWFPERNVFGNVRYMSSDSTRKKFKMQAYLDFIANTKGESLFP
jgi:deoxyribodipyrimidine photo-lyase